MPVIMSLCNYVLNTDVIALILMDQTEYILETDFNYTHVKFCLSISVRIRGVLGVLLDPFCLH